MASYTTSVGTTRSNIPERGNHTVVKAGDHEVAYQIDFSFAKTYAHPEEASKALTDDTQAILKRFITASPWYPGEVEAQLQPNGDGVSLKLVVHNEPVEIDVNPARPNRPRDLFLTRGLTGTTMAALHMDTLAREITGSSVMVSTDANIERTSRSVHHQRVTEAGGNTWTDCLFPRAVLSASKRSRDAAIAARAEITIFDEMSKTKDLIGSFILDHLRSGGNATVVRIADLSDTGEPYMGRHAEQLASEGWDEPTLAIVDKEANPPVTYHVPQVSLADALEQIKSHA